MQAHADPQRVAQIMAQGLVQPRQPLAHGPGGGKRLTTTDGRPVGDAEQRHHAVAGELVDLAATLLDGLSQRLEILVHDEHHVVRQPPFGHRGEASKIGEQHRDLTVLAGQQRRPGEAVLWPCRWRQQRHHIQVRNRPQLTCQPHIRRRGDALQDPRFVGTRWRHRPGPLADPDPAGRAATASAADRGVRQIGQLAGLEHRSALWYLDAHAARVGELDRAVVTPAPAPPAARQQHQDQRGQPPHQDLRLDTGGQFDRGPVRPSDLDHRRNQPSGIGGDGRHGAATLNEPQQRQYRHQQSGAQRIGIGPAVPGFHT